MPGNRLIWGITVSEGGLEHPFEWYITETVIYHQSSGVAGPHN
jgi:hypothetical protein